MRVFWFALSLCLALAGPAGSATPPPSRFLDDLTWTELRDALAAGQRTVIIPVGGTEQSGPHLALGKHNVRVRVLAGRIAEALGNALVAPVVAYVPEGALQPPTGHMRFAGTVSVPDAAFQAVVEGAARSFRQHGFTDVVLIGDHGGYQALLRESAGKLNRDWSVGARAGAPAAQAHFIGAYYQLAQTAYVQALQAQGFATAQIGTHAGLADTALMLAVDPALVRATEHWPRNAAEGATLGVEGDPRGATAALGQRGVDAIVAGSVAAIRRAVAARR